MKKKVVFISSVIVIAIGMLFLSTYLKQQNPQDLQVHVSNVESIKLFMTGIPYGHDLAIRTVSYQNSLDMANTGNLTFTDCRVFLNYFNGTNSTIKNYNLFLVNPW